MGSYRKKPVVVEAVQWDGVYRNGVMTYPFVENRKCDCCEAMLSHHGETHTLEGFHIVCPLDWIITGVKGERYPCKPDIFEMTYEEVSDDEARPS